MKKIIVKGPALSQTGYGEQTRFALRALRSRPELFDIYLLNLEWGKSNHIIEDDEERKWLVETIQKTAHYINSGQPHFDLSLQVTIPNEFERMAPINIGYTAGIETTKVAPQWLQKCNELMDKIIVVSNHSKDVFVNTVVEAYDQQGNKFPYKLEKPVEVVNYPVRPQNPTKVELDLPHDFNYLLVSQWGPRKNFENTIRWFVEENIDQEVGLVVKTNSYKNCTIDRDFTHKRLQALLAPYKDRKCSVTLLHGYMSEAEMQGLYRHENIKAFINIAHGEGYGLPLFDAAIAGLPIITIGWSGQCDFLFVPEKDKKGKEKKKGKFMKVDFDILPVQREAHWEGVIQPDSHWAFAREGSYKMALRKMKNEYHVYSGMAKSLQKWIVSEFSDSKRYAEFSDEILGKSKIAPVPVTGISFCIPTDGKKTEKTKQEISSIHRTMKGLNLPYEIVVAGDVSWLGEEENTVLVQTPEDAHNGLLAKLRNNAGEKASHDTLVFVDDDFIFPETWASRLVEFSVDNGWNALANKILLPDGGRFWDRATFIPEHKLVSYDHPSYCSGLYQTGGFWIIRKETYTQHKWDSSIPIYNDKKNGRPNEDIEMSLRYRKNGIFVEFDKDNYVWHNDDKYVEVNGQTLTKTLAASRGFTFFPPVSRKFKKALEGIDD